MNHPGECKLCKAHGNLRNSHILPEFLYKPMYDEKHCFMVINPNPARAIRKFQIGLRERLLCGGCEGRLAIYEKYVKEFIYDGKNVTGEWQGQGIVLHGLDYKTVRLYYLSLLWRMSVSSHQMFRDVSLGPHEDRLRTMILATDPGEPEEYGFFCIIPLIDGIIFDDWILEPGWIRVNGHRYYRIVIGGLLYLFTTNPTAIRHDVHGALLQKNGDWSILAREARTIPFLNKWFEAQAQGERARQSEETKEDN